MRVEGVEQLKCNKWRKYLNEFILTFRDSKAYSVSS